MFSGEWSLLKILWSYTVEYRLDLPPHRITAANKCLGFPTKNVIILVVTVTEWVGWIQDIWI